MKSDRAWLLARPKSAARFAQGGLDIPPPLLLAIENTAEHPSEHLKLTKLLFYFSLVEIS